MSEVTVKSFGKISLKKDEILIINLAESFSLNSINKFKKSIESNHPHLKDRTIIVNDPNSTVFKTVIKEKVI